MNDNEYQPLIGNIDSNVIRKIIEDSQKFYIKINNTHIKLANYSYKRICELSEIPIDSLMNYQQTLNDSLKSSIINEIEDSYEEGLKSTHKVVYFYIYYSTI